MGSRDKFFQKSEVSKLVLVGLFLMVLSLPVTVRFVETSQNSEIRGEDPASCICYECRTGLDYCGDSWFQRDGEPAMVNKYNLPEQTCCIAIKHTGDDCPCQNECTSLYDCLSDSYYPEGRPVNDCFCNYCEGYKCVKQKHTGDDCPCQTECNNDGDCNTESTFYYHNKCFDIGACRIVKSAVPMEDECTKSSDCKGYPTLAPGDGGAATYKPARCEVLGEGELAVAVGGKLSSGSDFGVRCYNADGLDITDHCYFTNSVGLDEGSVPPHRVENGIPLFYYQPNPRRNVVEIVCPGGHYRVGVPYNEDSHHPDRSPEYSPTDTPQPSPSPGFSPEGEDSLPPWLEDLFGQYGDFGGRGIILPTTFSQPTNVPTDIPASTRRSTGEPGETCSRFSEGDANCDRVVNDLDYVIWWRNFKNDLNADFNGDDITDDLDYVVWWKNYDG